MPWAVVFPTAGPEPLHPSQLYEAGLGGLVLFSVMLWSATGRAALVRAGMLSGIFLIGYALARILVELFREPDAQLGFAGGVTMGQLLSPADAGLRDFLVLRGPAPGRGPGLSGFEDRLRRLILDHGPIPVARYMALALAHLTGGYYPRRDPLGAAGDFVTAPEVSQLFGELIGLALVQHWLDLGARRASPWSSSGSVGAR